MVDKSQKLINDMELICVDSNAKFQEIIQKQNGCKSKNIPAGIAIVIDNKQRVIGTITDGDLRRTLNQIHDLSGHTIDDVMISDPQTVSPRALAAEVVDLMQQKSINGVFAVNEDGMPVGALNALDLIRAGIF